MQYTTTIIFRLLQKLQNKKSSAAYPFLSGQASQHNIHACQRQRASVRCQFSKHALWMHDGIQNACSASAADALNKRLKRIHKLISRQRNLLFFKRIAIHHQLGGFRLSSVHQRSHT